MAEKRLEVPEIEREAITLLYLGAKFGQKRKLRHCYLKIKPGWNDGRRITGTDHTTHHLDEDTFLPSPLEFEKRLLDVSPGAILAVDARITPSGNVSVFMQSGKLESVWSNEQDRIIWTTRHSATLAEFRNEKALKGEANVDLMLKRLDPIRAAYQQLPRSSRSALLAHVIAYITGQKNV